MPPFLTKQQFQIPSSVPATELPHLLPQPLRRSSQQIQPSIWLGTPPDSLRPPKCHTLTAVFLRLEPQSDTATTGTAGSPAMQKLSFGPATALAGCSQIVLENQSPNDPITQSLIPYRSISPSTISMLPIAATTSASNRPSHIFGNVCKLARQAARMCTR